MRITTLLAGALVAVVSGLQAAEIPARHPLAGTWTLRRADVIQTDGTQVSDPAYGPDAQGLLMVDDEGRYSIQIFRPERPKFASGDKRRGTPEEFQAALSGISTHVGHIVVDAANHTLIFRIDHSAFPNWDHTEQRREYRLIDGELTYKVPQSPGGTTPVSVWQRVEGRR